MIGHAAYPVAVSPHFKYGPLILDVPYSDTEIESRRGQPAAAGVKSHVRGATVQDAEGLPLHRVPQTNRSIRSAGRQVVDPARGQDGASRVKGQRLYATAVRRNWNNERWLTAGEVPEPNRPIITACRCQRPAIWSKSKRRHAPALARQSARWFKSASVPKLNAFFGIARQPATIGACRQDMK